MKKILLFSIVFIATGASAFAQKKISKETVVSQKKTLVSVKRSEPVQEKTMAPQNPKHLNLHRTNVQPAIVPAELKDERFN